MRITKRFLSLILALALVLGLAIAASATEAAQESEDAQTYLASGTWHNLNWALSNSTLTITGSGEMFEVPYQEYPWYQYAGQITKIIVGNNVTRISGDAFYGQNSVINVSIGASVQSIGNRAFCHCSSLTSVTIPASVKQLGNTAFRYCSSLESVNFATGSQVKSLLYATFRDCKKLVSVVLPDGLTSIGGGAFAGCSNLTTISLGSQLKTIGESAFENCVKLQKAELPATIRTIERRAFYSCSSLGSLDLHDNLETLGDYAFAHCTALSGFVQIPASLTTWGISTFIKSNLQEIAIYTRCAVGDSAFSNCKNLTKVTIGKDVPGIENKAFSNTALTEVFLPESVSYIGAGAFFHCTDLHTIHFPSGLTVLEMEAFKGSSITSAILPDSVTTIEKNCFEDCTALTEVRLGSGITTISNYMFQNCTGLKKVIFDGEITHIGVYAFNGCKNLTTINLPEGLEKIDERAFQNCDSLLSVTLPSSLKYLWTGAFGHCDQLESVTLLSPDYFIIMQKAFTNCPSLVSFKSFCRHSYAGHYKEDIFYNTPSVIIYGWPGTAGEMYANKNNIPFVSILDLLVPVKPYKIANVVSGVHVYWKAVDGVGKYGVWRSETGKDGTYKWLANPTVPHFIDTTAKSGKTYYYKVTSMDTESGQHSAKSEAIGITFISTPDITSRENTSQGIKLGWQKISGATGYAIYRKVGTNDWKRVATIEGGSTLSWLDTAVKSGNGTTYKYTIRALYGTTLSGCRNTGRTMVRLFTPTISSAAAHATKDGTAFLRWNKNARASGYEVRFLLDGKVAKTFTVTNVNTVARSFDGLTEGKTYTVQVRSYFKTPSAGTYYSAWSTPIDVKIS